ncbi:MAG: hypothetical protein KJ077_17580 [Anaerolineae bacterium]|nr:hypothetical protein [Anaerolineae bacterium]
MTDYAKLLSAYEVDVRFPDVSGLEHLEMLHTRSELAQGMSHLTVEQYTRLVEADKILVQQARRFYQAIQQVADIEEWRRLENPPVAHWWWYLDILAQLPELPSEVMPTGVAV